VFDDRIPARVAFRRRTTHRKYWELVVIRTKWHYRCLSTGPLRRIPEAAHHFAKIYNVTFIVDNEFETI
jgi:hypothetical protein